MKRFLVIFMALCLLSVSAFADDQTVFDAAVSYLEDAGLDITVTQTYGNALIFTLPGGGTASAAKADESIKMPVCWTEKWKAADFLQDAGIAVYDMKDTGNELHFSLPGGGTGVYYS